MKQTRQSNPKQQSLVMQLLTGLQRAAKAKY